MPKREDEYWAVMKEPGGRGLCPFCGTSNIYYNKYYKSWKCAKCERSFPTPSYGPGKDFGKEARLKGLKITSRDKVRRPKSIRWDGNKYVEVGKERTYQSSRSRGFPGWLKPGIVIFLLVVLGTVVWGLWGGQIAEFYGEVTYQQPPYSKTLAGEPIHLVNNKDATDPTWQQLITFLLADKTDQKDYSLFSFPCGAFAEEVHNNAEAASIRAAWVAVYFEGDSEWHALNAFETVDKGLVCIDCTGQGFSGLIPIVPYSPGGSRVYGDVENWDKIAYVQVGKTYGLVSLEADYSPEYSDYEQWQQDKFLFDSKRDAYMRQLGGRLFVPEDEYRDLMRQLAELDALASHLGGFWEPLGVVSKIEIYW